MRMKPMIYIAGPMRGYPNFNREAFNAAAKRLKKNWQVLNPVDFERIIPCVEDNGMPDPYRLSALIDVERRAATNADAIYLLKGWEKSLGANGELAAYLSAHGGGGEILLEGREKRERRTNKEIR